MSIRFTHLKIAGFKSFSDPTTVEILPGLTGIIGPNGCGKSNIVEAIRWVMGESSARSLRGGEMDDVIFAGTARRAARNVAEVSLNLDDTEEIAPPPFQKQNQLQISRQIERGSGSQYRINGKTQRARDVQTLFADMGSGPRSSAIISQNRIAQLISASPEERRVVLEEAAGIAGLYSRRREAELKLKATEENLSRLNDLREQLALSIESLNAQSIQATQYRTLSAELRKTENHLQSLYYQRAIRSLSLFVQKVQSTKSNQEKYASLLQQCQVQIETIESHLPLLRQKETQTRIQWEEKRQNIKSLQEDKNRLLEQIEQLKDRLQEANIHNDTANARVQKTDHDLLSLQTQLTTTQEQLALHPEKEKTLASSIKALEHKYTLLGQEILKSEQNLAQQTELYQQITSTYEQALIKQKNIDNEYQSLLKEYEECQNALPSQNVLQHHLKDQEQKKEQLDTIIQEQQLCETDLNNAKLHANQIQHDTQQTHEKYNQIIQQISEKKDLQDKNNIQIQNLLAQLQTLQNQCLSQHTQHETQQKINQLQQQLQTLKLQSETAQTCYQNSIKNRLEQESIYNQETQSYEQKQTLFLNAQRTFQQAEHLLENIKKQVENAQGKLISNEILQAKTKELSQIQALFDNDQKHYLKLNSEYQQAKDHTESFQETYNQHKNMVQQLQAKRDGLTEALSLDQENISVSPLPPIIEALTIPNEWISAIAAIFDDSLDNPASTSTAKGWSELPLLEPLFQPNIRTLSDIIPPPPALKRAFDAVGIVNSVEEGNQLSRTLIPGQSLITSMGDVWRWDGYHQSQHIQSKAAQRLLQRQILKQTEQELSALNKETTQHRQTLEKQQQTQKELFGKLQQAQKSMQENDGKLQQTKKLFLITQNNADAAQTQYDALQPAYQQALQEYQEKQELLNYTREQAKQPKPDSQQVKHSQLKEQQDRHNAKHIQDEFQTIEKQFVTLKDQYQQDLSQDKQNQVRLENAQEKISQLEHDKKQIIQQIALLEQQLQTITSPQKADEKNKIAQQELQTLLKKIELKKQEYVTYHQSFIKAQQAYQSLKERHIQQNSRIETLKPRYDSLQILLHKANQSLHEATTSYENCPNLEPLQAGLKSLRINEQQQKDYIEKQKLTYHLLLNEKENLTKQQENIVLQHSEWQNRLKQSKEEAHQTTYKLNELQQQFNALNQQPDQLQNQISEINLIEEKAQQTYINAQKSLMQLEQDRSKAKENLQSAEQQAIKSREDLLKAQAKQEQAQALLDQLKENIDPEIQKQSSEHKDIDISDQSEKKLKLILTNLTIERDNLGAVNLRAEIEREEKQENLDIIEKEYNDLNTAIQQLRESIHKLNQQSKEKLNAIFSEVDKHFQELFTRMFNGGSAYLKLLAHEDPLQSGLEIYVQPPGKKLSTLSLLSGGEQALTALSLVFAVSRCNPVPICVLDEVDAPLDDPNVERFCTLLTDMTQQAGTRFLVVTHHQLTMSHMNRLYGVTMQERGVSQIISIDLEHAVQVQQEKQTEQLGLI